MLFDYAPLKKGKLYNVSRALEFWRDIMYVQNEQDYCGSIPVFLADGDQQGGLIDQNILTRVKIQKGEFILRGNNVITNNILDTAIISLPAGEHCESMDKFLRGAESLANKLPSREKRKRYLEMIRNSLY